MKKFFLTIALAIVSMFFSGCSKNEEASIIGTWQWISCTWVNLDNGDSYDDFRLSGWRWIYDFKDNGICYQYDENMDDYDILKYSFLSNNTLYIPETDLYFGENGIYVIDSLTNTELALSCEYYDAVKQTQTKLIMHFMRID